MFAQCTSPGVHINAKKKNKKFQSELKHSLTEPVKRFETSESGKNVSELAGEKPSAQRSIYLHIYHETRAHMCLNVSCNYAEIITFFFLQLMRNVMKMLKGCSLSSLSFMLLFKISCHSQFNA